MQTYYFDMKDGAVARDTVGLRFPTTADLYIRVIAESGAEVHREHVYKGKHSSRASG